MMFIAQSFCGWAKSRNRAMFLLGCCTGFRISELLSLSRRDIISESGKINSHITVHHTKNKTSRRVVLNPLAKRFLKKWLKKMEENALLCGGTPIFCTSRGNVITRGHAYNIIRYGAKRSGLTSATYGTHSMRKTYAKHIYTYYHRRHMTGENIDPLIQTQKALAHKDINQTRKYLSFLDDTDDAVVKLYEGVSL